MNISLPDSLKDYVDEQVGVCGYGTSSEYVANWSGEIKIAALARNSPPRRAVGPHGACRCRLFRVASRTCAYCAQMTGKSVIPTRMAQQGVEDELTHYLVDEGSKQATLGLIDEIELAYNRFAKRQATP
jgi:hypothetical protein